MKLTALDEVVMQGFQSVICDMKAPKTLCRASNALGHSFNVRQNGHGDDG
jgi:hypothetical protein